MVRRGLDLETEGLKYSVAHDVLTVTAKPTGTWYDNVSIDRRPHKKLTTKNIETHPNIKIDPLDKRAKDLHIDTNTDLTGRKEYRAS